MTGFQSDDPRWQRHLILGDADWRILVRPLRPDDDPRIRDLLEHVSQPDLRLRFFDSIKEFSPEFIARLTHLDYARAMASGLCVTLSMEWQCEQFASANALPA